MLASALRCGHPRGVSNPSGPADLTGVLLINLGTPDSPETSDVRRYLREFLSDPRVIDIPGPLRFALVQGIIAPFRAPKSAEAYRSIWTDAGSPLAVHHAALAEGVAKALGPGFCVEAAMRYGRPAIGDALDRLVAAGRRHRPVQMSGPSGGHLVSTLFTLTPQPLRRPPMRH